MYKKNIKFLFRILHYAWIVIFIFIIIICILVSYGMILDNKIKNRINGKIWKFPSIMYSRVIEIEPNILLSAKDMVRLLQSLQYRQVLNITCPGEFVIHNNKIELLRRSFNFPDGEKDIVHVSFFFEKERLLNIYNESTKNNFGLFLLDPKIMSILYSHNGQQRLFVPRSTFPDTLIDMLLIVEDKQFYFHDGITISAIARAFWINITSGHVVQGGSTLTQQLVKNLFLNNAKSLWRKFNEAYMALIFDYQYSKDYILELYLNEIFFGNNGDDQIHGFPLASFYYFGRPVDELSLDQQATLIGMIKGASLYNPWKNPKKTLERRNLVLKLLKNNNFIDENLYSILVKRSLGVQPKNNVILVQPAFLSLLKKEIKNFDQINEFSGIKIFTTLDPISQTSAEYAMKSGILKLRRIYNIHDLEGAMVIIDRFSGEIRAMVGGSNPYFFGFNRALYARRAIGSLIKPAIYLAALDCPNKYRLNTWISDKPIHLLQYNRDKVLWSPRNYDRLFREKVMLIDAFAQSLNVPVVHLGLTVGLNKIFAVLKNLGISSDYIFSFPSILLGSINLTPMEVAQQFQTIASGGLYSKLSSIRYITDEDNFVLYQNFLSTERVISMQATYLVLYAMQQVVMRGTANILSIQFPNMKLAAKTGTTNDFRDSWFVGIDDKEVTVIWLGRDNHGITKLTGTSGALSIYSLYLNSRKPTALQLMIPNDISFVPIDIDGHFLHPGEQNYYRVLPIWINNLKYFYQAKKDENIILYDDKSEGFQSKNSAYDK